MRQIRNGEVHFWSRGLTYIKKTESKSQVEGSPKLYSGLYLKSYRLPRFHHLTTTTPSPTFKHEGGL